MLCICAGGGFELVAVKDVLPELLKMKEVPATPTSDLQKLTNALSKGVCDLEKMPSFERLSGLEGDIYCYCPPDVADDFEEYNEDNFIFEVLKFEDVKAEIDKMLPLRREVNYL
jgi:hypothetical protein